ncbi:MAG TPA: M23 family metallopeptidase [Polyangia bacterium]|nr:M23 family metallopeptidase [Polyangia bacterium]
MAKTRVIELAVLMVLGSTWLGCGSAPDDTASSEQALTATPATSTAGLSVTFVAPARPARTTDERRHLLYELVVQNTGPTAATIVSLDAVSAGSGARSTHYAGDALAAVFVSTDPQAPLGTIDAGGLGVFFLDATAPRAGDLPRGFRHALTVQRDGKTQTLPGPFVPVIDEQPIVIQPPLRGDDFLDLNGCCDGPHRRALLQFGTDLQLAQRFAIDFAQVDLAAAQTDSDPFTHGDPTLNESYLIFGARIHAVAPGEVVDVRDGVAENDLTQPLPPATIESAPGNYVVECLGPGRFALYAHMQTGSVRVHVGDRVAAGQVLGLVGNTGNSTMPHLHFHVMDGPSPLDSNGLPYAFARFDLPGKTDLSSDNPTFEPTPPPTARHDRLPLNGDILSF